LADAELDLLIVNAGLSDCSVHRIQVTLANALAKRGYRVAVASLYEQGPLLEQLSPDVASYVFGWWRAHRLIRPLADLIDELKPRRVMSAFVKVNTITALASGRAKTPHKLVLCEHNQPFKWPMAGYPKTLLVAQWMAKWTYRRANRVVCVSHGLAEAHRRISWLPKQKYEVIYDPVVSDELLALAEARPDHPWLDGPVPLIVSVGRLAPIKNNSLLIRAFARLVKERDARLIIFGEGAERAELEALAKSLGVADRIEFPGFVPNPYGFVRRADLLALTSLQEGLSDVIIEALAFGTSVVSVDCPTGPREILCNGEFGALVPVGDVPALADAMLHSLDNPMPTEKLIGRAQDFTVEKAVNAYERLLFGEETGA